MFSDHPEHFNVDGQEPEELPDQIGSHSFC